VITRKLSCLNLPWSTNWAELFGADRPLIVEIGFGNADYLMHLAGKHPDKHVIGLEISNQSMEKAEQKIRTQGLHNVGAVHSRAETALHHLFEPESITELHINNPDPWFKSRHSGRRLIQRDTVDAMVSRLVPNGLLYLSTDVQAYAEMSHEVLNSTPGLTNLLDASWVSDMPGRIVTKYEARGLRQGNPPKMFAYQRNATPAPQIPVYRELPMPHLILKTPLTADEMLERFERHTVHAGDGIFITYLGAFLSSSRTTLLVETTITEPTIEQHVALMLFPREEAGEYTLRYAAMGMPRITNGLHRATQHLGDWLVKLHPDAALLADRTKH
jgi:tRNA (guanine-N7-)-methyltransferase